MIDTDNSGTITYDELKDGLKRVGSELMESEIRDLMDAVRQILLVVEQFFYIFICCFEWSFEVDSSFFLWQADIDNSGTIDYGEFLAATVHLNKLEREENLVSAFSFFDKDGSGYITIDELQQACKEFGLSEAHLDEMIKEIDQDNVSFSFFLVHAGLFGLKNANGCIHRISKTGKILSELLTQLCVCQLQNVEGRDQRSSTHPPMGTR